MKPNVIAAGGFHSLALKADGSIISWGRDNYGQVSGTPTGDDFVQVAGGDGHSLALKADGSIISWGDDDFGQVSGTPTGNDFIQIAAGGLHSLALKTDGTIVGWGDNSFGQVSDTPTGDDFVQVAGGFYHSLALKADGSIISWGNDDFGQVSNTPTGDDFVQVAAGAMHSLALKADGSLLSWGNDHFGQVSDTPTGDDFVQVAGGSIHSLALKADGSIISWGNDDFGQVSNTPTGDDFVQVSGGDSHSLALKADGSIISWGNDYFGQVSDTPTGDDFWKFDKDQVIPAQLSNSLVLAYPIVIEGDIDIFVNAVKSTSLSEGMAAIINQLNIIIQTQRSRSVTKANSFFLSNSHKIKPGIGLSILESKIPNNIKVSYKVLVEKSDSISATLQSSISQSAIILISDQANSNSSAYITNIKNKRKVIIETDMSSSLSTARRSTLAIQGNLFFNANIPRNISKSLYSEIFLGFPAIIIANRSTSKSVATSPSIKYNLLDFIRNGDNIYLLTSDDFGNTKLYRGVVRDRKPQDRLLTITAITGDGILSERIIKEDYPAQDIGLTAKEIIDTYCSPLTSTNVNTNTGIIAPVPANKKTPLSVFESLRREYGINYYVDYAWDVHIYLERSIYGTSKYILKLGDEV